MTEAIKRKPPPGDSRFMRHFKDKVRMWPTLVATAILLGVVYHIAPQQLGILVYTLCKLTSAGLVGSLLDNQCFPEDRVDAPDMQQQATDQQTAMYRRAAIVSAAVIASGLMS